MWHFHFLRVYFLFLKVTKKRKANGRKWGWRKEVKSRRKWKPSRKRNKRNKSKRCKTPVQWTDWITLRLYVRLVRREKKEEETRRKTQTTHGVVVVAAARLAPAQWKMRRLEKEQNKTRPTRNERRRSLLLQLLSSRRDTQLPWNTIDVIYMVYVLLPQILNEW